MIWQRKHKIELGIILRHEGKNDVTRGKMMGKATLACTVENE